LLTEARKNAIFVYSINKKSNRRKGT